MALDDTLVARALSRQGQCYGAPDTRTPYLLGQYPGDVARSGMPTAAAQDMGRRQSGCLLFGRGVLAADEVDGVVSWGGKPRDVLRESYASPAFLGKVEAMLLVLARARGCLIERMWTGDDLPDLRPADLLVIGQGGSPPTDPAEERRWRLEWGGVAHGAFVVERSGYLVSSVDGGVADGANGGKPTAIRACARRLERRPNGWWLCSASSDRRLNYVIRCGALPLRGGR